MWVAGLGAGDLVPSQHPSSLVWYPEGLLGYCPVVTVQMPISLVGQELGGNQILHTPSDCYFNALTMSLYTINLKNSGDESTVH